MFIYVLVSNRKELNFRGYNCLEIPNPYSTSNLKVANDLFPENQAIVVTYFLLSSATEYRNWLLHYSVPVLKGVLPDHYFLHYTMLVTAIAILVSDQISQQRLQQADELLENFCKLMPVLYGKYKLLFIIL